MRAGWFYARVGANYNKVLIMGLLDWIVFAVALMMTLGAAAYARRKQVRNDHREAVAGRSVGPWLMALSAGATANSGVALTALVGLGYMGGLVWMNFGIGWLLGDIFFWVLLAERLNRAAHTLDTATLPEMLQKGAHAARQALPRRLFGLAIVLLSMGYVGAQWLAAGKIGGMILGVPELVCTAGFAIFVIGYTAFSGVRGSIYTDFVQALFMLLLVGCSAWLVVRAPAAAAPVPAGYFSLLGSGPWWQAPAIVLGFAVMALGFDMGQPQMVSRWMSGENPGVMRRARWIYMGFVQLTAFAFIMIGMGIRLAMPGLADGEGGLVAFIHQYGGPGMMGVLMTGAVATIASTGSGIVAVGAEMLRQDVVPGRLPGKVGMMLAVGMVGAVSLVVIPLAGTSVMDMALTAVGLMSAIFLAPMVWVVMGWRIRQREMMMSMVAAAVAACSWRWLGWESVLNECVPGVAAGLAVLGAVAGVVRVDKS